MYGEALCMEIKKRLSKPDLDGNCDSEVTNILLLSWNYKNHTTGRRLRCLRPREMKYLTLDQPANASISNWMSDSCSPGCPSTSLLFFIL